MKNIVSCLLVLAFLATACNVTDLEPESVIASTEYWKSARQAEAGIVGVYSNFYNGSINAPLYLKYLYWGEARADVYDPRNAGQDAGVSSIVLNRLGPSSSYVASWAEPYQMINRANTVLQHVPGIEDVALTPVRKNQILGEALFLRALNYFYLVRAFGDVPLMTEASLSLDQDFGTPRTPKAVVLDAIVADLITAEQMLPVTFSSPAASKGRATVGAAKALLTSVYLWQRDYLKAAAKAKEVMDMTTTYQLEPDFATIFRKNSRESIFEIQFSNETQDNNRFQIFFLPPRPGVYLLAPNAKLLSDTINGFRKNDKRRNVSIGVSAAPFTRVGVPYVNKYTGAVSATLNVSDANQILLRLADVMLMRAEALNELGANPDEVITLLNRIRDRAYGVGVNPVPVPVTQAELRDIILQERYLELAFEGHRWFDLVRTEQVDEVLGADFPELLDPEKWLFPIAESIINTNPNITPNPGWQ